MGAREFFTGAKEGSIVGLDGLKEGSMVGKEGQNV